MIFKNLKKFLEKMLGHINEFDCDFKIVLAPLLKAEEENELPQSY